MKNQTLEELIEEGKKIHKEMLEASQLPYDDYMAMNNYPTPDEISINILEDFIKKVYEAGGEAERERFIKILKNTPYSTSLDNSTSGFIERVIDLVHKNDKTTG